ncbi:MAG: aminomethyl-transferring glycine dehydrogenase subunit GcvPB [Bacteriovoracaceae bacterium]|nr:aminomethyl-transferring glycine dehydrogenase subunit GcvPB [Bacteriovoracaceae bacterium]
MTKANTTNFNKLDFDPTKLPRELTKYYISSTESEKSEMLKALGTKELKDLFSHIPDNVKFETPPFVTEELGYNELITHLEGIAAKNNLKTCFIGDGLKNYKVEEIVPYVCNLRGLTTAYTPYQPERSQGTLQTLWIYSSSISMLTGFEAINASFYERSTALYEAIQTATRIVKNTNVALVCESLYPGDIEVLKTQALETGLEIHTVPTDKLTGFTDVDLVKKMALELGTKLCAIVFPQVNNYGNLEDVHSLTDICEELKVQSIALFDPLLLATEALTPPSLFGSKNQGCNMIVGEGQHLALGPNFGGPGLGIFGIRYNEKNKLDVRQTAGRFIGKAKDQNGKEALCIVLATREQHIRREKATSNICSNQSFVASAAGAAILSRGESGMTESALLGRDYALQMANILTQFKGVNLAFPSTPFYNEFVLELPIPVSELQKKASAANLQLGVDVSKRLNDGRNLLLLSFFDVHTDEDLEKLENFFLANFDAEENDEFLPEIPETFLRKTPVGLPNFELSEIKDFYKKLADLNVSPDDNIYPLGSCTMKYNPYINDWAASLKGFTDVHPQAPIEDVQGCLEILFNIQEMFKSITGLPAVTTQPVAGAQGELVGIKLFQGYHRNNGEDKTRNIILIPRSAHGTNPATATMAGFETKIIDGVQYGIVIIEADSRGQMNFEQLKLEIEKYSQRIAGVMVTNPNTSGIFETRFKDMADLIHAAGGLVYMDGANMNAIAGWIDLNKMGVDAVHNNLHKTWTIPHGGGGPGDSMVAVSHRLIDYLPGIQVVKKGDLYDVIKPSKSIGSFHRHLGNFAHKVRAYTYIKALGGNGVREMSGVSVLAARYLYNKLKPIYPSLPENCENEPRMHEFILTISKDTFDRIEKGGTPKAQAIAKIGKLYLDFGLHAPTVAFPEMYGLMIEPTESYSKAELDKFVDVVTSINTLINETPEVLTTAPHFTPIKKIDEVDANKNLVLSEKLTQFPKLYENVIDPLKLSKMNVSDVCAEIERAHKKVK